MGLVMLSVVLAIVAACILWLILGSQLPLKNANKLPTLNNIVIYALASVIPIYLTIFLIFSVLV